MQEETKDRDIEKLRDIFLGDIPSRQNDLTHEMLQIKSILDEREKLGKKIEPILQEKFDWFRENFPREYGNMITEAIKVQIRESQDEVVDALYPIIGKLIRKFLQKEIERLNEKIDHDIKQILSPKNWVNAIVAAITGKQKKPDTLALGQIVEVLLIDRKSGLLLSEYSSHESMDRDVVSGMLSAVKSFVEDAFRKGEQELEMIEYETYKIILHNFPSYLIAVVVSGPVTSDFKLKIQGIVYEFAEKELPQISPEADDQTHSLYAGKIKTHFFSPA